MKGIVFTSLGDMIIERYGLETWDNLLSQVNLESGGSYAAGGTYPDTELVALVTTIAKMKNIEVPALLEQFGEYMFPVLAKKYPIFIKKNMSLKDFLKSIDDTIHVEVMKINPDAELPSIKYEEMGPNQLTLLYRSRRKLCNLAIGLIQGAATHFHTKVKIKQPLCMHHGSDHCRLEVTFE
ncbi:MAG: hypothetical protein ACD_46C00266G0003 [uncultured bacterium]|nr:MAG: hypothetical protein ACD_46C00266G0003 [uncultured bacterium]